MEKKKTAPKKTRKIATPEDKTLAELKEIRKILGELKEIADSIWRERRP